MKIAGFQKQSFIDYPGKISCVLFTQGCNFRCGYCHNAELVLPEKFGRTYELDFIFAYLHKYKHLLDAVCITGGEPTLHNDLPDFISKIKALNLEVKLDTNGTNTAMIKQLIDEQKIDFIAMDIKHLVNLDDYRKVAGSCLSLRMLNNIKATINLLESSGIPHQFRTTLLKGIHTRENVKMLQNRFSSKLQQFNPENVLDSTNYSSDNILSLE